VELFIQQFTDVEAANQWNNAATLLHLRSCLQDDAVDCGIGQNTDEIYGNLRARFGLTARQARDRLSLLQRTTGQSLQALGLQTERLVAVAYPAVPPNGRVPIAIDAFTRALDNRDLKRHLLLAGANTLADTVRRTEEYFQVSGKSEKPDDKIQRTAAGNFQDVPTDQQLNDIVSQLDRLTELLEQQAQQQQPDRNESRHQPRQGQSSDSKLGNSKKHKGPGADQNCYDCGEPGHFARNCPLKSSPTTAPPAQPGNDQRPRQ
jgi:hypothetical protein